MCRGFRPNATAHGKPRCGSPHAPGNQNVCDLLYSAICFTVAVRDRARHDAAVSPSRSPRRRPAPSLKFTPFRDTCFPRFRTPSCSPASAEGARSAGWSHLDRPAYGPSHPIPSCQRVFTPPFQTIPEIPRLPGRLQPQTAHLSTPPPPCCPALVTRHSSFGHLPFKVSASANAGNRVGRRVIPNCKVGSLIRHSVF